jgi:hypothetical protein
MTFSKVAQGLKKLAMEIQDSFRLDRALDSAEIMLKQLSNVPNSPVEVMPGVQFIFSGNNPNKPPTSVLVKHPEGEFLYHPDLDEWEELRYV